MAAAAVPAAPAVAPPPIVCGERSRSHGHGSWLIHQIQIVQTWPGWTAYDVLDLPMYKTHAEHASNHDLLVFELSFQACTCANRAASLAAVNAAWALIATPALKLAYDNGLNAVPPVWAAYLGPTGIFPSVAGEMERRYPDHMDYPSKTPNPGYPMGHPLCLYFKGVQHSPGTSFRKLRRSNNLLWRREEYSFWFALSMAMYPGEYVWPELKYKVRTYLESVLMRQTEPRFEHYWSLINYSWQTRFPEGDLFDQVSRDPPGPYRIQSVTPEMWQIVADALKIELMVIIAHVPHSRKPPHKTIVARGSPLHPQYFLYLEEDGEYRSVVPFVDQPSQYRFTSHLAPTTTNPPGAGMDEQTAKQAASDLRRCPLVAINEWGLPAHLDPPRGQPAIQPQGIEIYTPALAWPPVFEYIAPFGPLPSLYHDANPRDRGMLSSADMFTIKNPTSGRWV